MVLAQQSALVFTNLLSLGLTGLGIDLLRIHLTGGEPPNWPFGWTPPEDWSPYQRILCIAGLILALAVFEAVQRYLATMTAAKLMQKIVLQLRAEVYDKLQRLSFRFYDTHQRGTIINRVTGDVQAVRLFVDGVIIQVLAVTISLAAYLYYMLSFHVPLTFACLATTPFLWVASVWFSRKVRPLFIRNSKRFDDLILALSENVQGVQVVKGFAQEDAQRDRFARHNDLVLEGKHEVFWITSVFQPIMGGLTQGNLLILLAYGGYLVIQGELRLGEGLFVFANLLQLFANQVGQITNISSSIQQSLTGAQRVFEILDAPLEIESLPDAKPLPRARGEIVIRDLSFSYLENEPVLRGINLEIKPGECLAITGATGSGKSTLLNLLCRFYDPTSGSIELDGIDLRQLDLADLRRNIGLVFQETFLFSNSVTANIAFGDPQAHDARVEVAARSAAVHHEVMALPHGYDTVIGEYGCDLSGGQRQRMAIARALLLDPPILILDDALASVDSQTEQLIMGALEQAMRGRTTVVVAQRLSVLRRADRIVVLEEGQIAQIGTHDELMAKEGIYRRMARVQLEEQHHEQTSLGTSSQAVKGGT